MVLKRLNFLNQKMNSIDFSSKEVLCCVGAF